MNTARLRSRALLLSYITIGYNVIEGLASITAGVLAGSSALLGFGVDSFFESLSGGIMVWRFSGRKSMAQEAEERTEKKAVRLVALTFILLGAYVFYESVEKLAAREAPLPSLFGLIIATASIIVMPILYRLKLQTGEALGSRSLVTDSKETLACSLLSAYRIIFTTEELCQNRALSHISPNTHGSLLSLVFVLPTQLTREKHPFVTSEEISPPKSSRLI